MRPLLRLDDAVDLVAAHPLAALGLGAAAALISWLLTRARSPI